VRSSFSISAKAHVTVTPVAEADAGTRRDVSLFDEESRELK
jgi:hypothetical protein